MNLDLDHYLNDSETSDSETETFKSLYLYGDLRKRILAVYNNCIPELKSVATVRHFDVFRISVNMLQVLEIIQKDTDVLQIQDIFRHLLYVSKI